MSAKKYEGGCLCGRIRFVATGGADFPHTCSCSMCQRHSGALTLCWVEFPKDAVEWTGEGELPALYRSSAGSSRAFCGHCGSTLGAIDDAPTIGLVLGCFDCNDQEELEPTSHSFELSKPAWCKVSEPEI